MTRYHTPHGAFEIDSLPSQTQVAVCHGFFVPDTLRGIGNGHRLKAAQNEALAALQHDYALCTVAAGNHAQKKILGAAGWVRLTAFRNRRSSETTEIWGRAVHEQEKV